MGGETGKEKGEGEEWYGWQEQRRGRRGACRQVLALRVQREVRTTILGRRPHTTLVLFHGPTKRLTSASSHCPPFAQAVIAAE